jgi:site-specific DNA recombinase
MQRALIYCRVSTEEQAKEGYSLEAQEKYCRQYTQRSGYSVVRVFRDEGKSGTNLDRPALKDLLAIAQQGKNIDAVVVQETDRLARNTKDHLTIKALLQKAGVRLISVAQPMLDDSPEGMMVDTIIASVNQFQSDINSRKTKKGLQEKFDSGWWPGWAPLGYFNKKLESGEKIVVPDPNSWSLIKQGFTMYLSGKYSALEIADALYKKGLRSKTGKKICNSIMLHILRNPFYSGVMKWNGQINKGKHKAMISTGEHQMVLQIMNGHNLYACRRRKHNFLLNGIIFCNICGGRYTAEKHAKKGLEYYHCAFNGMRGQEKPHTNRGQNVKVKDLEVLIEEQFKRIQFTTEFIDLVTEKIKRIYYQQRETVESQKIPLRNQKMSLERKRDIAEEKLLDGIISDQDFTRIRAKLDSEIDAIQEQFGELNNQRAHDIDLIQELLKLTRNVYQAYKAAPYELKRHYLELFWDKFLIQDKKIVQAIPTMLIKTLMKEKSVIISSDWLRE